MERLCQSPPTELVTMAEDRKKVCARHTKSVDIHNELKMIRITKDY